MFCKYCHFEFYVPGDTLGAKVRCPNCTGTLRVEDKHLLFPCAKCGGMLDVSLWMIGSEVTCPHCQESILLKLGEDSRKYFPDSPRQTAMLKSASRKEGDIIGRYRVIRCLGVGGMGEVYLVEHTLLNTKCALKLLKKDISTQDPEMRERLLREARLASQIQHPNLIAVLDAELDENSETCYIVMEYVDGVSIEYIIADEPMLEERALEIISKVVEALKEAAAHKIIHRDIKPANIMLSSSGEVKLADLGIAKVESDNKHHMTLTMDNAVLGTPNYASPEQLRSSHKVDSRADIYSLGATLYHMLTGKRPFEAESVFGVMANVLEKELPPANSVNPEITAKTSNLISWMMAKKREERPENFDVLLAELTSGTKKNKIKVPKFEIFGSLSKYLTLRNIWSAFLGIVAVTGLCVATKILHNNYKNNNDAEAYNNFNENEYVVTYATDAKGKLQRMTGDRSGFIPKANMYSPRPRRNPSDDDIKISGDLKTETEILKKNFRKSELMNLSVRKFEHAAKVLYHLKRSDSAEWRKYDNIVGDMLSNYFKHLFFYKSEYDQIIEAFNALSIVDGDGFDKCWSTFIHDLSVRLCNYLQFFDRSNTQKIYELLVALYPDTPYRDCLKLDERLQHFMHRDDYRQVHNILDEVKRKKDVHLYNALAGKYVNRLRVRGRTVQHLARRASLNRDVLSMQRLAAEYKEAVPENTEEYNKIIGLINIAENQGKVEETPELLRRSMEFLIENGSAAAAKELLKRQKEFDQPFVDKLFAYSVRNLYTASGNTRHIAVVFAFIENGYLVKPQLKLKLQQHHIFKDVTIYERVERSTADNKGKAADNKSNTADTSTVKKVQEDNSALENSTLEAKLILALNSLNIRMLKAIAKEHPGKLSSDTLEFARAALKLDYMKCCKIADSLKNKTQLRQSMNNVCFMVLRIYRYALPTTLKQKLSRRQLEVAKEVIKEIKRFDLPEKHFLEIFSSKVEENIEKFEIDETKQRGERIILYVVAGNVWGLRNYLRTAQISDFEKRRVFSYLARRLKSADESNSSGALIKYLRFSCMTIVLLEAGLKPDAEFVKVMKTAPQLDDYLDRVSDRENNSAQNQSADSSQNSGSGNPPGFYRDYKDIKQDFIQQISLLRKALDGQRHNEANDSARQISQELLQRLKLLIKGKEYRKCRELLLICQRANINESRSEWRQISFLLRDEYVRCMNESDNQNVLLVFRAWVVVDRVFANNYHAWYTDFERAYLRRNYREADRILGRCRFGSKIIKSLRERLNNAKLRYQSTLESDFNSAVAMRRGWLDDIVDEMVLADCEHRVITNAKRRARRAKVHKIKRSVMMSYLSQAISYGEVWKVKLALEAGANPRKNVRAHNYKNFWEKLLWQLDNNIRPRESMIACLLAIADKCRLTEVEKRKAYNYKEIAEFVFKE